MEIKNYYPLRMNKKHGSSIVSSVDPERQSYSDKEKKYEIDNYGGHIIAESLPSKELAQQLVDAYNEKYGPCSTNTEESFDGMAREVKSEPTLDEQINFIHTHQHKGDFGRTNSQVLSIIGDKLVDVIGSINQHLNNKSDMPDEFKKHPLTMDECRDKMFVWDLRDITPGDIIQTALQEGSITVAQSIQLYEINDEPAFKNMLIQFQRENEANKKQAELSQEFIDKNSNSGTISFKDAVYSTKNADEKHFDKIKLGQPMSDDDWIEFHKQESIRMAKLAAKLTDDKEAYETIEKYQESKMSKEDLIRQKQATQDIELICTELTQAHLIFNKFVSSRAMYAIADAADLMIASIKSGGKLLSCGNGGSYSDAQHFASELSGKYRGVRPAIAAMALSDGGAMSCIANDFGFHQVFSRQIEAIGRDGDVLLCLSTSGNSDNVLLAASNAQLRGIKTIGICGNSGGMLKQHLDVMIEIPHSGTADRIQELSIVIIHILVNLIEKGIA